MTDFSFEALVNSPYADIVTAALGVAAGTKLTENDIGKPVKLAANDNYVLCAAADEIEGFLKTVAAETVNDGFSVGSVQRNKRIIAKVLTTAVVVGDLVVAAGSAAVGTADAYPLVKKALGTEDQLYNWRVISIRTGTGVVGDMILIEKI